MAELIPVARRRGGRRMGAVSGVGAVAVVALASAAWACVPAPQDKQTKVSSCTPPAAATKPCKTPVGAPAFPNATFVKGPSGSRVSAYVTGPGMSSTELYDLVFATKPQLESGMSCGSPSSVVISGGPVLGSQNGGISSTSGTIPANSPLGLSQICFTNVNRPAAASNTSTPAQFKVTV